MANQEFYPIGTPRNEVKHRYGHFTGNGTSNPTLPTNLYSALIKTATRSSTGVYTLTFDKKYPILDFPVAKVVQGTTAYLRAEFTAIDVTAGTATLKCDVNGTLTDAGTSDVVYIMLVVRNTGRNK